MSIEITIKLTDQSAQILRSWRSVADSLNSVSTALATISGYLVTVKAPEDLQEIVRQCHDDSDYLRPAIAELCYTVRDALVANNVPALWDTTTVAPEKRQ